jgi:hypothetical protein
VSNIRAANIRRNKNATSLSPRAALIAFPRSTIVAAVGYVIHLPTREEDRAFIGARHRAHRGAGVSRRDLGLSYGATNYPRFSVTEIRAAQSNSGPRNAAGDTLLVDDQPSPVGP